MTSPRNAVVWIDHQEARIFHVDPSSSDQLKIDAPHHHVHRHPKGPTPEHRHPDDRRKLFDEVEKALRESEKVIVLGPGTAKLELVNYAHEHARALVPKVVAVETVDHPTDAQIVAYAKRYFHVAAPRA